MTPDELCEPLGIKLEGQANDLAATLTSEKLIKVVPEQETDLFRVFAHFNYGKFLQTNHLHQPMAFGHDILET